MLILDEPSGYPVETLAFSADGAFLATVAVRSHLIRIWDLNTRQLAFTLGGHSGRVVAIAFAPSGEHFAAISFSGSLWMWDCSVGDNHWRGAVIHSWPRPAGARAPGRLVFSPDSRLLVSTQSRAIETPRRRYYILPQERTQVAIVAIDSGKATWLRTNHLEDISCAAFAPHGHLLATGSFDRTVRLHDLQQHTASALTLHQKVHFLAFSGDGSTLSAAAPSGLVRIWEAETGHQRLHLHAQPSPIHSLCYSPDGRILATAGGKDTGVIQFWEVLTGSCISAFDWNIGEVHAITFDPAGMRAAAGGRGRIVIWDIDDWG